MALLQLFLQAKCSCCSVLPS